MLSVSGKINDKYISKNNTHPGQAYHRIVPEVEFAKMVEMNRRKLFRRIKKWGSENKNNSTHMSWEEGT